MIESVLAFFAGFLLTWPDLILLLSLGALAEHNEAHGFALFLGVVSAVIAYFFFNLTLASIALYALGYVAVGLVWSVWRYKRHADNIVTKHLNSSPQDRAYAIQRLHPMAMLSPIVSWVVAWPFSAIVSVCSDLLSYDFCARHTNTKICLYLDDYWLICILLL